MIDIKVKLFAHYRQNKFNEANRSYAEGTTIEQVIKDVDIDIETYPIGIILVNGKHKTEDYVLKNGDILAIFPKVGGG